MPAIHLHIPPGIDPDTTWDVESKTRTCYHLSNKPLRYLHNSHTGEDVLDHRERFIRTLTGQEVDRVPFIKVFGGDNAHRSEWEKEYPGIGKTIDQLLRFEGPYRGWQIAPVNMDLCNMGEPEVTHREDGDVIYRWENGTVQIRQPGADFYYHTTQWPVKNREDWERLKVRQLDPDDPSRFPDNWSDFIAKFNNRDYPLQLTHRGVYGFTRNLMGDEALAYMFYDAPELIHDMMDYYTDTTIQIWEKMAEDVQFDLIEFWEDMANKNGSMISPATFREFMKPNYLKVADFAQRHNIPIILVDSDGNIEELTGLMLESGVTTLYPYEVQAGNDTSALLDRYPKLGAIGGLNKNVMAQGKAAIDHEMERARDLIRKGRFIPGPDHFVLSDVSFANYRYFMESLREVVMTTKPGS
jgi:uroporphyrinogen decarboxylase